MVDSTSGAAAVLAGANKLNIQPYDALKTQQEIENLKSTQLSNKKNQFGMDQDQINFTNKNIAALLADPNITTDKALAQLDYLHSSGATPNEQAYQTARAKLSQAQDPSALRAQLGMMLQQIQSPETLLSRNTNSNVQLHNGGTTQFGTMPGPNMPNAGIPSFAPSGSIADTPGATYLNRGPETEAIGGGGVSTGNRYTMGTSPTIVGTGRQHVAVPGQYGGGSVAEEGLPNKSQANEMVTVNIPQFDKDGKITGYEKREITKEQHWDLNNPGQEGQNPYRADAPSASAQPGTFGYYNQGQGGATPPASSGQGQGGATPATPPTQPAPSGSGGLRPAPASRRAQPPAAAPAQPAPSNPLVRPAQPPSANPLVPTQPAPTQPPAAAQPAPGQPAQPAPGQPAQPATAGASTGTGAGASALPGRRVPTDVEEKNVSVPATASRDDYTEARRAEPEAQSNLTGMINALHEVDKAGTGRGSYTWQNLKSSVNFVARAIGVAEPDGSETSYQVLKKQLVDFARKSGMAGASVAQLQASFEANPNTEMNPKVVRELMLRAIGEQRIRSAILNSSGPDNYAGIMQRGASELDRMTAAYPHMNPEERRNYLEYVRSLNDQDREKLNKKITSTQRLLAAGNQNQPTVPPGIATGPRF